jgi:hypothetical protein
MARPKWEKDKVFTGQQPAINPPASLPSSPRVQVSDPDAVPYIPSSVLNDVYETGAAGFPTTSFVSPEEKRINELEGQLSSIMQQLEGQTSDLAVHDGTLMVHGFQLTSTGLIAPESASSDAWIDLGRLLARLEGSLQWLIGDWIVYGEAIRWGDIPALAKELGFSDQTLRDYAYVARNVQLSIRIDKLSFGHHQVVAPLSPQEQWDALQYAAEHNLSIAAFRKVLRGDTSAAEEASDQLLDGPTTARKLTRFFKHDPSTSAQKAQALSYIQAMRRHLDVLEKKCR